MIFFEHFIFSFFFQLTSRHFFPRSLLRKGIGINTIDIQWITYYVLAFIADRSQCTISFFVSLPLLIVIYLIFILVG